MLKKARKANLEIGLRIRAKAIEKFFGLKHPEKTFKYFTEVLIVFIIAAGILIWLDPAINIVPAPFSYFFLLVLLIVLAYIQIAFK